MASKGGLGGGGLATALQIVSDEQISGVIRVSNSDGKFEIHCIDGKVVQAIPAGASADERLGEALIRNGAVSRHDVDDSWIAVRRSGGSLGEAMVRYLDRDELRRLMHVQISDVIFELFMSKRGRWEIDTTEGTATPWGFEIIDSLALIEDGRRVLAEWPVIRSVVDSPRLRFKRVKDVTAASGLGPNDHFVFTLVRADRDVTDIEHLARLGRFEADRALYQLASEGYIVAKGLSPEPEAQITPEDVRRARRLRMVHALGHLAVCGLLAVAVLHGARQLLRPGPKTVGGAASGVDSDLQAVVARTQSGRILAAVEIYRIHKGVYPENLPAVVEAGLLREDDLTYPLFAEPFVLEREGDRSYTLTPPLR